MFFANSLEPTEAFLVEPILINQMVEGEKVSPLYDSDKMFPAMG